MTSGGQWHQDAAGLLCWHRVVEATRTPRSGWHRPLHALWCWAGQVDDTDAQSITLRARVRWDRALRRTGFDSTPVRGVDTRRVRFADDGSDAAVGGYFTKIAAEVTAQHAKDSRSGRSPFAILRDAAETYRVDDLELWWEWKRASHGRTQLTWSLGGRERPTLAGLRDESDELTATDDLGSEDHIALSGEAWEAICRGGHDTGLLDMAETEGMAAMTGWLDARGLGWIPATRSRGREVSRTRPPQLAREARAVLTSCLPNRHTGMGRPTLAVVPTARAAAVVVPPGRDGLGDGRRRERFGL